MGELDENMACQELVELVTAYLEGYLATAERSRLEEHLATCSGCRTYLEQMRMTLWAHAKFAKNVSYAALGGREGDHECFSNFTVSPSLSHERHNLTLTSC
jgi:predicted anti-sigma-YlaC factor YlaD